MLLTVLVGMVGAVGTAVSVSRAREAGFLTRLAATPGSRPRLLGGWVLAAAAVDVVQLVPVALAAVLDRRRRRDRARACSSRCSPRRWW